MSADIPWQQEVQRFMAVVSLVGGAMALLFVFLWLLEGGQETEDSEGIGLGGGARLR